MKQMLILLLAVIALNTTTVFASAGGTVEAIQMPAWYDRDGETYPLKPGIELYSGDVIRTGNHSRALLRMNEGSTVKLGADATLNITSLAPPKQASGIFAALLRVARGAFRYTTTALGKDHKRDINIKIGHVAVGIRGTDIWGRSMTDSDLFCLIEGDVSVQRDGEAEFRMQEPLKYITAETGKPTSAVMDVDMTELGGWAAETELQQGMGVVTASGGWAVNMMSLQNSDAARKLQQTLHEDGFAAEVQPAQINGQDWLRIRIEGFVSRQDANSYAETINNRYGIQRPWIVKL